MNCPVECPENLQKPFDRFRRQHCDGCHGKRAKDKFKEKWIDEVFYRMGSNKFRFERVLETFFNILSFENLPPGKMSVKTRRLLSVYNAENLRFEKIVAARNPAG